MKYNILTTHRASMFLFTAFLFGAGSLAANVSAQTPRVRPAPTPAVTQPARTGSPGTGVGGATGAGVGGQTGTGIGGVNGAGMGTPSGSTVVSPSGNPAGQSSGTGTGTVSGNGTGTASGVGTGGSSGTGQGGGTGNGTGVDTGASTGTPAVNTRTYIKEISGRCYYVTPMGAKRYVARRNCALYQ